MKETFIDQATYSVSLLFSKYCFKLDKNINKIISDSVSLYLVRDWHAVTQIKKFPRFPLLLIQSFSSQQKFLRSSGLRQTNNY